MPDPMDPATYERSKLDWSEMAAAGHAEVLGDYKRLIALRRAHPDLSDPSLVGFQVDVGESTIVMHRGSMQVRVDFAAESFEVVETESGRLLLGTT